VARRLTTACSRRPRQSSNLHTQICRLSGARLMLAVRRHCQCGAGIRTSTCPVTHSARVERCCGDKVTHIVSSQPLMRGLPLLDASTNRASAEPIPIGTTGLLITRSPVCPERSSLSVNEPFNCNPVAATTAARGCGKPTPKKLPFRSASPTARSYPSNAPPSTSLPDVMVVRTSARTSLRHVRSAIFGVTAVLIPRHHCYTVRWCGDELQKENGTPVVLGVYFQTARQRT
jgi:hypothetical protein